MSPDAFDETFEQDRANEIADKVWRMSHGFSIDRKTIIEWSGR